MSSFKEKRAAFLKMKKGLSLRFINKIIFFLIIAMSAGYLFGVNSISIKGFELSETNKKTNDLAAENKELELKIMQLESYNNINEKVKSLGLVKVDKVDYVTASIGVAMK
jgi:hypothetical protein